MWALAAFSCAVLVVSGPWLSWRLPTNMTGVCLTVAGFALVASIYGSYTPSAVSPWAEQLLPTVYIAAIAVAVSSWPTGRMPARWSRPFRRVVVVFVIVGVGSKFVLPERLYGPWWPAHDWELPALPVSGTTAIGVNVEAVVLMGAAPVLFLAFVARRRASMPASVRATSRPAFAAPLSSAPLSSGPSCRRRRLRLSVGPLDDPRRSGSSGRGSSAGAMAPSPCSSSGRSR